MFASQSGALRDDLIRVSSPVKDDVYLQLNKESIHPSKMSTTYVKDGDDVTIEIKHSVTELQTELAVSIAGTIFMTTPGLVQFEVPCLEIRPKVEMISKSEVPEEVLER